MDENTVHCWRQTTNLFDRLKQTGDVPLKPLKPGQVSPDKEECLLSTMRPADFKTDFDLYFEFNDPVARTNTKCSHFITKICSILKPF